MSLEMTTATRVAAITFLGLELEEGQDPTEVLSDALSEHNMTEDDFLTEETVFAIGFHRGLAGRVFSDEDIPTNEEGASESFTRIIEDAFAFGMEARSITLTPPPSLVHSAWKSGDLALGAFGTWAQGLELSEEHRFAHAITVGSGKSALTIPAGTPVQVLNDAVEKDGEPHIIVLYAGLPLIVPNPDSDPRVVSGDTKVAKKSTRKSGTRKASGAARQRGPSLKDAITNVIEGSDGGPGPLQDNGQFAGRVLTECVRLGIREKAGAFVRKSDRHVPYYLNCYTPDKEKDENKDETGRLIPGRTGIREPLVWVVAAIQSRRFYLKGVDMTHEERLANIPEELVTAMEDREVRVTDLHIPEKPTKAAKSDNGTEESK